MDIIKILSNAFGAPGFEDDVIDEIKKYYGEKFDYETDSLKNLYVNHKSNSSNKDITIMLDGHLDEVGFMVHYIDSKGLIHFISLGGWVVENIPAQLLVIKNRKGEYIKGIVSSKPPHFMTDEEKNKKLSFESLTLDIGAVSREEVTDIFNISVGDPIVPYVDFDYNSRNQILMGKAFDNRLGSAAALKVLEHFSEDDIKFNLVSALAAQEEVGTRGAELTSKKVAPDLAIVFEGSPADDLYYPDYRIQGGLKRGTQIRLRDNSYISNKELANLAEEIAKENKINYQTTVRSGGGTNAGKIHLSNSGVPVLVLGIPVRYAHTHHCYSSLEDFQSTVDLAIKLIEYLLDKK